MIFKFIVFVVTIVAFVNCRSVNPIPKSLDWRNSGRILDVPNQGKCGNAGLINALDSVSASCKKQGLSLQRLSQQQIYDCGPSDWCPCEFIGNVSQIYSQIMGLGSNGIDTEQTYPFTEKCDHKCKEEPSNYSIGVLEWTYAGNEDQLLDSIQSGPIVAEINVIDSFLNYAGGIYDDINCTGDKFNHVVFVVGYGIDESTGAKYWIIRNSWGTSWGEAGYMRMAQGNGRCGIGKRIYDANE